MSTIDEDTSTANDRMVNKVMGLLAKAESTTPEEAEALLAKATELMSRYEIDEAMLAHANGVAVDTVGVKRIAFQTVYSIPQRDLMFAIGRAHGFKIVQSNGYNNHITGTWVGFEKDMAAAEMLLTSLLIQQITEAVRYMKSGCDDSPWETGADRVRRKRSHMIGFAQGAGTIIRAARATAADAAQAEHVAACPDSTTSVALVLKSKDEQVKDWYDTKYGKLRSARKSWLTGSSTAVNAGFAAGQRADVGSSRLAGQKELGR